MNQTKHIPIFIHKCPIFISLAISVVEPTTSYHHQLLA